MNADVAIRRPRWLAACDAVERTPCRACSRVHEVAVDRAIPNRYRLVLAALQFDGWRATRTGQGGPAWICPAEDAAHGFVTLPAGPVGVDVVECFR